MQNPEMKTPDQSLVMPEGIGARLRIIRRTCNLQQVALAERMGVVQQSVSAWEREHTYMTLPMLWTFCKVTGVSADLVLGLSIEERADSILGSGRIIHEAVRL